MYTFDNIVLDTAYAYVLSRGFPYYEFSLDEKKKELEKIKKYDFFKIIQGDVIRQTMHGLGLAWSYFPHSWSVQTRNMKTPMEVFEDKVLLKKAVDRRLKRGGFPMLKPDGSMTDSQIRKALRSYSGVQSVSNFRPSAAAAIYQTYAGDGIVWDMSCGFGGRYLGALASGAVKFYYGTDPSTETFKGLQQMQEDFQYVGMHSLIQKRGSEDKFLFSQDVDLCFTSPPYFNTEKYSDEITQSYLAYNNVEDWNENFLRKTIQNCYSCLKPNGHMILNVANVISHKMLEDDTVKIAQQEGFTLMETLKLQLSSIIKGGFKHEPTFVFKKI
jgi:SAM-dependent methyltransferase